MREEKKEPERARGDWQGPAPGEGGPRGGDAGRGRRRARRRGAGLGNLSSPESPMPTLTLTMVKTFCLVCKSWPPKLRYFPVAWDGPESPTKTDEWPALGMRYPLLKRCHWCVLAAETQPFHQPVHGCPSTPTQETPSGRQRRAQTGTDGGLIFESDTSLDGPSPRSDHCMCENGEWSVLVFGGFDGTAASASSQAAG